MSHINLGYFALANGDLVTNHLDIFAIDHNMLEEVDYDFYRVVGIPRIKKCISVEEHEIILLTEDSRLLMFTPRVQNGMYLPVSNIRDIVLVDYYIFAVDHDGAVMLVHFEQERIRHQEQEEILNRVLFTPLATGVRLLHEVREWGRRGSIVAAIKNDGTLAFYHTFDLIFGDQTHVGLHNLNIAGMGGPYLFSNRKVYEVDYNVDNGTMEAKELLHTDYLIRDVDGSCENLYTLDVDGNLREYNLEEGIQPRMIGEGNFTRFIHSLSYYTVENKDMELFYIGNMQEEVLFPYTLAY